MSSPGAHSNRDGGYPEGSPTDNHHGSRSGSKRSQESAQKTVDSQVKSDKALLQSWLGAKKNKIRKRGESHTSTGSSNRKDFVDSSQQLDPINSITTVQNQKSAVSEENKSEKVEQHDTDSNDGNQITVQPDPIIPSQTHEQKAHARADRSVLESRLDQALADRRKLTEWLGKKKNAKNSILNSNSKSSTVSENQVECVVGERKEEERNDDAVVVESRVEGKGEGMHKGEVMTSVRVAVVSEITSPPKSLRDARTRILEDIPVVVTTTPPSTTRSPVCTKVTANDSIVAEDSKAGPGPSKEVIPKEIIPKEISIKEQIQEKDNNTLTKEATATNSSSKLREPRVSRMQEPRVSRKTNSSIAREKSTTREKSNHNMRDKSSSRVSAAREKSKTNSNTDTSNTATRDKSNTNSGANTSQNNVRRKERSVSRLREASITPRVCQMPCMKKVR
jgi:hypothetical protein